MPDSAPMPGALVSGRIPGLDWLPAYWQAKAPLRNPDLLVIHSAATGDDPAKWLHNPIVAETTSLEELRLSGVGKSGSTYLCDDGEWRRMGGAHISARNSNGGFVQQTLLTRTSPHAGGSVCQGRKGVNARSVGVELPAHRGPLLEDAWAALMGLLLPCCPSLRHFTLHRWIRATKKDPVCWSDATCRRLMGPWGLSEAR